MKMQRARMCRITFLLLLVASFSFGVLGACKKSEMPASTTSSAQENEKDLYTCPMHPQIKKDAPGQCPICGMNLVKVAPSEVDTSQKGAPPNHQHGDMAPEEKMTPEGHASFSLTPARGQMIGVQLGVVEEKPLFKKIRAAGRLAFDPELYSAQSEYIEALKQFDTVSTSPVADVRQSAKRMVESARLRLKILGLSDKQISELGKSETDSANLLLNKVGQDAWVYADVYEMDLPLLRPGLSAEISAGFLGGKVLAGKLVSVDRVINPATRTAKARILISEARSLLRPESYVDVEIMSPLGNQITVPFDAVFDTGKQSWVFVADGEGKYEPRLVTVRLRAGGEVAIASGLRAGEKIVTSANFLIDSESRLKGAMMAPSAHGAHGGKPGEPEKKAPACPKGQHWDDPMKMCMPDIGG